MSLVWLKSLFSSSRRGEDVDQLPISRQNQDRPPKYIYREVEMPQPDTRTPLLQHTSHTVPVPVRPAGSRTSTLTSLSHYQSALSHHSSHSNGHQRQPHWNGDVESNSSRSLSPSSASSKRPWWKVDARVISDATIGLSDGLTVPFALTAGLSALGNTRVVIYGGLAELIAGAISMGLGGYLGAKSELASYKATKLQTRDLIATDPSTIKDELAAVFEPYDLPASTIDDLTLHLSKSPHLIDFFMRFQQCLEEPASSRALTSALTIAGGYFFGGLLPLLPYFFVKEDMVFEALYISIGVMVVALFWFGYVKTCVVTGWSGRERIQEGVLGGGQMVVVGGAAAAAAMGLVWLFNSQE